MRRKQRNTVSDTVRFAGFQCLAIQFLCDGSERLATLLCKLAQLPQCFSGQVQGRPHRQSHHHGIV